ncbi:MAG: hypothetical protein U9N35_02520 [Euryarchaeota archaeon]|nr:hypothetical protein [Euryarchaeota archaeon]
MDSLKTAGFLCIAIGIGVPVIYGVYEFIISETSVLIKIPVLLAVLGFLFLMTSAIRDRLKEEKVEI